MSATTIYRYTITTPEKKNKEESILINLVKGKIIYLSISLQIIAMQIPTRRNPEKGNFKEKKGNRGIQCSDSAQKYGP